MRASRVPPTFSRAASSSCFKLLIAEHVEEHGLDQGLGRLAARAVRHRDAFFPDLGPTAAGPVDAVKHLLFAVGRERATAGVGVIVMFPLVLLLVLAQRLGHPASPATPAGVPSSPTLIG